MRNRKKENNILLYKYINEFIAMVNRVGNKDDMRDMCLLLYAVSHSISLTNNGKNGLQVLKQLSLCLDICFVRTIASN